jgi:hypothetical protein
MSQQVVGRWLFLDVLSQLDRRFPFLRLCVAPADPHARYQFGLLPGVQTLNLFPDFFAGKVIGTVLQDVAHLIIRGVGARIGVRNSFLGLHPARFHDEPRQIVGGYGEVVHKLGHSASTRARSGGSRRIGRDWSPGHGGRDGKLRSV